MQYRQDQNVRRRLRVYILNCNDIVVAKHFRRRNVAGNDLTENAVRVALRHNYVFGLSSSKLIAVSGRGMYPPIDALNAIGTVVWTIEIAGA